MIGHTAARLQLEAGLPPAALITGPVSIGKRTLVSHLLTYHKVMDWDLHREPTLTVDGARTIGDFVRRAPFGTYKVVAVDLDQSNERAANALLKIVEEPPATARFLFTASKPVLPTIASRCSRYPLAPLSDDEVRKVLHLLGMPTARAELASRFGHGQIRRAQAADQYGNQSKAAVVTVVRAIALHDHTGFLGAFKTWDDVADELLIRWLTEAISGRYAVFTHDETFGLHRDRNRLMQMIRALGEVSGARARLSARAALEPFV